MAESSATAFTCSTLLSRGALKASNAGTVITYSRPRTVVGTNVPMHCIRLQGIEQKTEVRSSANQAEAKRGVDLGSI